MFKEELYMFLFLLFIISLPRILPFLAKYFVFILYFFVNSNAQHCVSIIVAASLVQ